MSNEYAGSLNNHYGAGDLEGHILGTLRAAGKSTDHIVPQDIAPMDHLHTGGLAATLALAHRAGVSAAMNVLDIGGGIGGPARTLAATYGCHVTVLDLTEEFCRVGAALTARAGLEQLVSFQHGSAFDMPFAAEQFDLAWTQHSSMNMPDKSQLYAEARRVLRPGGLLALHEIMAGPVTPVEYPVPWAADARLSFLLPPDEMRAILTAHGFVAQQWDDVTAESLAWLAEWAGRGQSTPTPLPSGAPLPPGRGLPQPFAVLDRNLREDRLRVVRAILRRA